MQAATGLAEYQQRIESLIACAARGQWDPAQVSDVEGLRSRRAYPAWGPARAHAQRLYATLGIAVSGEDRFSLAAFEPLDALLPCERSFLAWQERDERRHALWQHACMDTLAAAYGPFPAVDLHIKPRPKRLDQVLDCVRREARSPLEHIILSQFLLENTAIATLRTFVMMLPSNNPVKALFRQTLADEERHKEFGKLFVAYRLPRVSREIHERIAASIQAVAPLYVTFIISLSSLPDPRPPNKYVEYAALFASMCRGFQDTNAVLRSNGMPPVRYLPLLGGALVQRLRHKTPDPLLRPGW